MRRFLTLLTASLALALLWFSLPYLVASFGTLASRCRGGKTVEDRLRQYGPAARARLAPRFAALRVAYPPAAVCLAAFKHEKVLQVYAPAEDGKFRLIRAYPILAASGQLGPKLTEGDLQVPEGIYRIDSLHPNSLYHLALRVNYPNEFDREMARRDGRRNLGSDIMIHGSTGSVGCLAVGDEAAEDLFVLAGDTGIENIKVILAPMDLRRNPPPAAIAAGPEWVSVLYGRIRGELDSLPPAQE